MSAQYNMYVGPTLFSVPFVKIDAARALALVITLLQNKYLIFTKNIVKVETNEVRKQNGSLQ